jgi:3-hydroxyisobutyrate dehydrogenase-like beta-hydroxyacid dehydrogenase
MSISTVAILSPGEMGAAVGAALHKGGMKIITCFEGRGAGTRERAEAAGFRGVDTLDALLTEADIVFSILPPEHATALAETVAEAMRRSGNTRPYCDCNAVAPDTARAIGAIINAAGAPYIDGGIVGSPPGGPKPTRVFVCGPEAGVMDAFDGMSIAIRQCGPELGRASAIKMVYAAITKGTSALHAAVLLAAEKMGVTDELYGELAYSQGAVLKRMENMTPALPAVAERFAGEMREIAATLAAVGVPSGFHDGAAELYELLDRSPLSAERRDTVDRDRTLRQTIEICAEYVQLPDAAE